jgi:hypothetical protein
MGAIVCGLFAALVAYASATATFLFTHPRARHMRIEIDRRTGQPIVVGKLAEIKSLETAACPRVECRQAEYDFGVMDPLTMGRHEFVLKNIGRAPLKLSVGPTTCKCTVSGLDRRELPPGGEAQVTLEWNTGRSPLYAHAATIYTSDPDRKSLEVRVRGKVRMHLGADVSELSMADVRPGEAARGECLLYSQVWDDFEIESVESGLAGLTWEAARVEPAEVPRLEARAVQWLRIAIPPNGLAPRFADTLRIAARVPGRDKPVPLELSVQGNVLGPYTVYGSDIVGDAVQLGSVPWGRGKKSKLLIKVHDPDPELGDVQVAVEPGFLRARLARRDGSATGLYDLHLELPAESDVCQYLGTPQGEVTIATGHPRIGTMRFPVRFAVLAKEE